MDKYAFAWAINEKNANPNRKNSKTESHANAIKALNWYILL